MLRTVLLKTLYEKRWSLLGWSIATAFVAYLTMIFFPSLSQNSFDSVVNSVPDSLKGFVGNLSDYNTITGYIAQQIFGPNLVILTIVMSVIMFLSVSSGDEERGSLKTLLTYPVSRKKVFIEKYLAIFIFVGIVSFSIVIGTLLAVWQIHESVSIVRLLQSAFACWLMNAAYGTVGFAVAMAIGSRGLSIAIGSAYAFLSVVISSLAAGVSKLSVIDHLSIFHYYNDPQVMNYGLQMSDIFVLCGAIIVMLAVAIISFTRRDIKS